MLSYSYLQSSNTYKYWNSGFNGGYTSIKFDNLNEDLFKVSNAIFSPIQISKNQFFCSSEMAGFCCCYFWNRAEEIQSNAVIELRTHTLLTSISFVLNPFTYLSEHMKFYNLNIFCAHLRKWDMKRKNTLSWRIS